jgi:hypothetical protein
VNTSYNAIGAALSQFTQLLADWLRLMQGECERDGEIKSLGGRRSCTLGGSGEGRIR